MKKFISITSALLMSVAVSGCWNVQTGSKIGFIVKTGEHGAFSWCTSFEAELIRGGMNNGSGGFGVQPFDFTVEDPTLAQQIIDAMDNQKELIIYYHRERFTWCRSETNYFVDRIEIK